MSKQFIQQTAAISTEKRDHQQQQSLEKAMQHSSNSKHSSNNKQCNTAAIISGERN
jgi:hypothetical protein